MHSGHLCAVSSGLVAVLAPVPTGNVKVRGGGQNGSPLFTAVERIL